MQEKTFYRYKNRHQKNCSAKEDHICFIKLVVILQLSLFLAKSHLLYLIHTILILKYIHYSVMNGVQWPLLAFVCLRWIFFMSVRRHWLNVWRHDEGIRCVMVRFSMTRICLNTTVIKLSHLAIFVIKNGTYEKVVAHYEKTLRNHTSFINVVVGLAMK